MRNTIIETVIKRIFEKKIPGRRLIIAIDGRCAAGKTTLAKELENRLDCTVFNMDDYFLRPNQISEERLKKPGENIDHERFLTEILRPLTEGADFIDYKKYDCKRSVLLPSVRVIPKDIVIVEGAYSCHSTLFPYYDLRIFLDISPEEQKNRLIRRNGQDGISEFEEKWIPLEEMYFKEYKIENQCDLYFE